MTGGERYPRENTPALLLASLALFAVAPGPRGQGTPCPRLYGLARRRTGSNRLPGTRSPMPSSFADISSQASFARGLGRGAAPAPGTFSLLGERSVRRGMKRSFARGGWSEGPRGSAERCAPSKSRSHRPTSPCPLPPWGGEGPERPLPKTGWHWTPCPPGHEGLGGCTGETGGKPRRPLRWITCV